MWTRQGDLYSLVSDMKQKSVKIPPETCPYIDAVIETIELYVPEELVKDTVKEMETIRSMNSDLRTLGHDWYEMCNTLCEESDKTIKDLEKEIEMANQQIEDLKDKCELLEDNLKDH